MSCGLDFWLHKYLSTYFWCDVAGVLASIYHKIVIEVADLFRYDLLKNLYRSDRFWVTTTKLLQVRLAAEK